MPDIATKTYDDFVAEQLRGELNGVFIDDTGSPGLACGSEGPHPERKSWVAVVIPRTQLPQVWQQFPAALRELRTQLPVTELHFADIYMGRREFKHVPWDLRMSLFKFMAYLFATYRFSIIVQTLDPSLVPEWRAFLTFPESLRLFDFTDHSQLALFILLVRVKLFLTQSFSESERPARVFVDEGFKKQGRGLVIETLAPEIADGLVCFGRSDAILPLQLADFAAFCMNRVQLLLFKPRLSHRDREFLEIASTFAENYQNLERIRVAWPRRG
jgi:hypothetical protein